MHIPLPFIFLSYIVLLTSSLQCDDDDERMRLVSLRNENAICNDGSRAGFYISSSDVEDDDVWLIHLQGGGWCWSKDTCEIRHSYVPQLMTNSSWSDFYQPKNGSIFSFFRNRVFVPYCSSDGYIGNTDIDGNQFRGRTIIKSIFQQIHDTYNLSQKTVVFSGCSAGGRGVMHNLNLVREQVETYNIDRLIGLVDSGEYIDLPLYNPLSPTAMGSRLRDQALGVVEYLNASISNECASFYPNATENCLMGETAFRTLSSPFIAHSFQFDSYQNSVDFGPTTTPNDIASDASMTSYENNFRARTRKVLLDLAENRSSDEFAFHSSACWHHCNTETSSFSTGFLVNSTSLSDVLMDFLYRNGSRRVMEDCEGIACGGDCS